MPYFIESMQDKFCVRKGTKEDPGAVISCHDTTEEADDHLKALYANVPDAKSVEPAASSEKGVIVDNVSGELAHDADGRTPNREPKEAHECVCPECGAKDTAEANEACSTRLCPKCGAKMSPAKPEPKKEFDRTSLPTKDSLTVYKSGSTWRWNAVSNVATLDREGEIITEKAYDDAIAHAYRTGSFGEIDLVHVDGTDIGACDSMTRVGPLLIEGGYFFDTALAQRARKATQFGDEAISIKFRYDPSQFDGIRYNGGIQIIKRTILPRDMAASVGTAIAVSGGEQMKGIDEKARAALLSYGVTEDEIEALANAQKGTEDTIKVKRGLLERMLDLFGVKDKSEVVAVEKEVEPTPAPDPVTPDPITDVEEKALGAITESVAKSLAPSIGEAIVKSLAPIQEQLSTLDAWKSGIEAQLKEVSKSTEQKVLERLSELPQVVKVRPTQVAPVVEEKRTDIPSGSAYTNELVSDVMKAVSGVLTSKLKV